MKDMILGCLLNSVAATGVVLITILWLDEAYKVKYGISLILEIVKGF